MDLARQETGVDKAVAEFNVTGRGVLVAIMDRGIDWRNTDFRDEHGSTRIEYIYDLTDDSGAQAAQNAYGVGTIYTKAQIDQALTTGTTLRIRDAVGHGTTTAGIACGNGRARPDLKFRGVAPAASMLVVKICCDETPAHDSEAAERHFWKPERVLVAIDFVAAKARELRLPCVMVLNIGSQGGPTDGTSELCRKIDQTVGPGKPGLIFVTGPGDEGTKRKHDRTTVLQGVRVPVGTIWDGASALHNICPGDYVIRTHWTDVDGQPRSHADEGKVGEIWKGSSVGPTADGRFGIDFCAPGDSVFTTYNPKSHWATFRFNLLEGGNGLYGRASAVSAAAPMAAGILALMLEVNPRLDAIAARRILQDTSRRDAFTGRTPNSTWGYGKVDAYAAIKMAKQALKSRGLSEDEKE
jgi:subtilisin family serine protease